MNKIYTFLLYFVFSISFGQFSENFDTSTELPLGWEVFIGSNGNGITYNWIVTVPPENIGTGTASGRYFSAPNCAFVRYQAGSLNEDWLVTPAVDLTNYTNSSLTFYAGQQYTDPYNTIYKVKVSTTSQTDSSSFVDIGTYGEADFTGFGSSPLSNLTAQKTISLAAYGGQQIYIAFVMIQNDGDNWSLDDVAITGTLGTTTFDNNTTITVFPNPTKDILTINSEKYLQKSVLYDVFGKLVKTFENSKIIDIADVSTGVYILKITTTEGIVSSHRVVKN